MSTPGSLTDLHALVLAQEIRVDNLTLDITTIQGQSPESVARSLQETLQILRHCAPTLASLRLEGFCMEDLTTGGQADEEDSASRSILEAIGACRALRSLYISCARPSSGAASSQLLMQLAASLPELRTLQWRCAREGASSLPENHFSEDFVSLIASTDNVGLQLLQVENCTFGDMPFSLPGSLRILSMKCEQVPLESQLSTLLRDCHSLEELYLTAFTTSSAQPPDLSVLLPNAATLRSLVIDIPGTPVATSERVPESLDPSVVFPVLDVIVITNVCNSIDELPSRCPALCALGLTMTDGDFFFPVVKAQMNQQGCTLQHLQLCLALDLYTLMEHSVWESVGHITSLLTLQIIFADYDNQQDLDEQMLRLFGASLTVEGLCMPNLQHVAIYLEPEPSCAGAHFQYNPQDPGACKILSQVGSMVAAGIWPSLTQVDLHPCVNVLDGTPYEGPAPSPTGAPNLAVSMYADRGEAYGTEPGLRKFTGACNCPRVSRAMASLKRA